MLLTNSRTDTMRPLLLLLFCALLLPLAAQERYTEAEVMREAEFLAADAERVRGNYEAAETTLKKFLEGDRDNAAALYSLAQVYAKTERYGEAEKTIQRALEVEPNNEWYGRLLGFIYETTERDDRAAEVYADLAKTYPDREYFAQRHAYFLVRSGEPKTAIAVYDRLERRFGMNEEYSRDKHRIYLAQGDYKRAERELQALTDRFPDNPDYLHYLANFYQQIDEPMKARSTYARVLELDPDDARAQVATAGHARGGATGNAKLAALAAIFEKPDVPLDVKVKQLIPYVQRVAETQDLDLATQLLPSISTLEGVHGASAPLHALRGDLAFHTQQPELAYEQYAAALQLDASVYPVWENALYALDLLGDYERLADQTERALDYYPNQPFVYLMNARAYNRLGDYAAAQNALLQSELMVRAGQPLYVPLLMERARTALGTNDRDEATEMLRRAEDVDAKHREVLELRALLSDPQRKFSKEDAFMRGLPYEGN